MEGDVDHANFPISLGTQPEGHKTREGDGRTPEGAYFICTKNPNSSYHKSLGLSYPNAADAKRAMTDGAITADECQAIQCADDWGERPLWGTLLGGFIMIHGGGTDGDWTAGCVAVENDAMDVLFSRCELGTKVEIVP